MFPSNHIYSFVAFLTTSPETEPAKAI